MSRIPNSKRPEDVWYRAQLKALLKASGKSRAQIADELAAETGDPVTERRLHCYLAESREDYRFPAELELPLCRILNDYSLLAERVKRAGFRMIGAEEERLIEIGLAFVARAEASRILRGVK